MAMRPGCADWAIGAQDIILPRHCTGAIRKNLYGLAHMISIARNRALAANSRLILMAGFGGLLLLMAFAEFDGMQALTEIQRSNDEIREDFLRRTRVLDRIRADLYVSGTYVRDYLLEPESGKAEGHRYSMLESRSDMDAALDEYRKLVNGAEAGPF